MKNKKKMIVLIGIVLIIVLVFVSYKVLVSNKGSYVERISNKYIKVEDFTVYDLKENEISLSNFKNKPLIIYTWVSYEEECKEELKELKKVYDKYNAEVEMLIVNWTDGIEETILSAQNFLDENNIDIDTYYDINKEFAYSFVINSAPRTYFINKYGELVIEHVGKINKEEIEQGILKIVN